MNKITLPEQGFVIADDLKPISQESEQALIGCVLRGGRGTYERVREIVTPEMFWWSSHQSIWQALERLYEAGHQIDTIVLGDEMERMKALGELEQEWGNGTWSGRAYLGELRANGDPRHADTYAARVQDYHFKRFLLEFSGKMAGWSANGRAAKDIMQDVYNEFGKIELYNSQDEYTVGMDAVMSEVYDWTGAAAAGKVVGIPTGLVDLDKLIKGLIPDNVYLVAARPGQGKTGLLLTIARNVARRGKRVGIFSLEMSRLQVGQRLLAQESEIDLQSIIHGTLREDEWPRFTHGVEIMASLPIVINDLSSISISQIRNTARRMKRDGLDLLIVDYIQLAGTDNKKRYENRNLEVTEISRGLKHLARELDVPILAAAQLNRAVEARANKKAILSDLRESGSLEQDSYAVMFLNAPDDETKAKTNLIQLELAKHRNGPPGEIELMLRRPLVKFENAFLRGEEPQGA